MCSWRIFTEFRESFAKAFQALQHSREKRLLTCPSVRSSLSTCISPAPTTRISRHLCLATRMEICREKLQIWFKIGQKYRAIQMNTWVRCTVASDTNSPQNFFCTALGIIAILVRVTHRSTIHYYALLRFPCNNGYTNASHCSVLRTLSIFLILL